MTSRQLAFTVTVDGPAIQGLVEILTEALSRSVSRPTPTTPSLPAGAKPSAPAPLLWTLKDVAKALQVSEKTVWTLRHERKMPEPLPLMSQPRWSAEAIRSWIAAGCPSGS